MNHRSVTSNESNFRACCPMRSTPKQKIDRIYITSHDHSEKFINSKSTRMKLQVKQNQNQKGGRKSLRVKVSEAQYKNSRVF